jgi:MFS family permease
MTTLLIVLAVLTALVAGARSTWSPCGLSMLSSITPLAEHGRGHRYRTTACWFVLGAVVGGALLGLVTALLSAGIGAAGLSSTTLAAFALAAGLLAAASDAPRIGFRLPVHHRQVNERWLDQFRPWVYGAGFGWQIGTGVTTYIKTSAVYLTIALAALTGEPRVAVGVGALFGLVRGLGVFLGRGITTPAALADFHRRFTELDPEAARVVVAWECFVALIASFAISPWAALALVAVLGAAVASRRSLTRRHADARPRAPHDAVTVSSRPDRSSARSA